MSEHVLALIDQEIDRLSAQIGEIDSRRIHLSRERESLLKLTKKSDAAPAKASRPKPAARKAGGPSVKEQILSYLRERGEPARIAQIVEAIGAKSTSVNGTLHQLKKAGQVTNTVDGWAIAVPGHGHNGGDEARA